MSTPVYTKRDLLRAEPRTLGSHSFLLRCPDGRVRRVTDRGRSGFSGSGDRHTRTLWWHDLVDWSTVGIGPATWNWAGRECCPFTAPDGRRCALPVGHVFYLHLGHRLADGRRFVARLTPYWPRNDPKRRVVA